MKKDLKGGFGLTTVVFLIGFILSFIMFSLVALWTKDTSVFTEVWKAFSSSWDEWLVFYIVSGIVMSIFK